MRLPRYGAITMEFDDVRDAIGAMMNPLRWSHW